MIVFEGAEMAPLAAAASWARIDRELTNLAVWLPTVPLNEVDLVSRRVGNYHCTPCGGCCSTSCGSADRAGACYRALTPAMKTASDTVPLDHAVTAGGNVGGGP